MNKISFLSLLNWALLTFMLVIAFGSPYLAESSFISQIGRFHPLFVHLPIGIWILTTGLFLLFKDLPSDVLAFSLKLGATSALASAILGILLVTEPSYTADGVWLHKWLGVGFGITAYLTSWSWTMKKRVRMIIALTVSTIFLILTGHHGGNLTHGEDFLFPPEKESAIAVYNDQKSVYENVIYPIFETKCVACHKAGKSKGELKMTDTLALLAGGESGPIIDRSDPQASILLDLVHLPLEDKRHMPPKNKKQLEDLELSLISEWIKAGSSFSDRITKYKEDHPLALFVSQFIKQNEGEKSYDFTPASSRIIDQLNTDFRTVQPLYQGSPALSAQFFVASRFNPEELAELGKIGTQLVSLSLNKMPVTTEDLSALTRLNTLEQLYLNGTEIDNDFMNYVKSCDNLKQLSLTETEISELKEEDLKSLKNLEKIYLTNTKLDSSSITKLREAFPNLEINYAEKEDGTIQLTAPQIANENIDDENLDTLFLTNIIQGVETYFSLDPTAKKSEYLLYEEGIPLTEISEVSAYSAKEGWDDSDLFEFTYFEAGIKPDSVILNNPPSKSYPGKGGKTLNDNNRGEPGDLRNDKWLGYIDNGFSATMYFDKPRNIRKVAISYGVNVPAYVVNPRRFQIEVNGRKYVDKQDQHQDSLRFEVKNKYKIFEIDPVETDMVKIEIENEKKLPSWHQGKGQKGWFFIDEIYFY